MLTSSKCRRFFSLKSISARGRPCASSNVFLTILDVDMMIPVEFGFGGRNLLPKGKKANLQVQVFDAS